MSPFSFTQAGPTHELLTAGGQGVTHDTKGSMLFIPASVRVNSSPLVLTWDFNNRGVSADIGADNVIDVSHQYDALGRRVARTASSSATVFVQVDQQRLVIKSVERLQHHRPIVICTAATSVNQSFALPPATAKPLGPSQPTILDRRLY